MLFSAKEEVKYGIVKKRHLISVFDLKSFPLKQFVMVKRPCDWSRTLAKCFRAVTI